VYADVYPIRFVVLLGRGGQRTRVVIVVVVVVVVVVVRVVVVMCFIDKQADDIIASVGCYCYNSPVVV